MVIPPGNDWWRPLDRRGRGKSEGERFIVEDLQDWASDVVATVSLAKSAPYRLPVFLLGHSAGGVASATYVLDNQSELAWFICEDFASRCLRRALRKRPSRGSGHIAPHLRALKLKNEDFSRDPSVVEALNNNPLTANEVQPVVTVATLVRADERLHDGFPSVALPLTDYGKDEVVADIKAWMGARIH